MNLKTDFTITKKSIIAYTVFVILLIRLIIVDNALSTLGVVIKSIIWALVFIYLMAPIVRSLTKKFKLNRKVSVLFSFLLLFVIFTLLIIVVTPAIVHSTELFIQTVPKMTETINNFIIELELQNYSISVEFVREFLDYFNSALSQIARGFLSFLESAILSAGAVINGIFGFIIALLVTWYGLTEYPDVETDFYEAIKVILPNRAAIETIRILKIVDKQIKKFIVGKGVTCIFVGVLSFVAMVLFNSFTDYSIPFVSLIALIVGITNMIPYLGPIIGAVPSLLFALIGGFPEFLAVLVIIFIIQQLESIYLTPKVLGSVVGISPFWTVVFLTMGGALGGLFGLLLSVPIGATLLILWHEYESYKREREPQLFDLEEEAE
jgi:predicted PurR-regulated permease PerM